MAADVSDPEELARDVVSALRERGETVALCESLTAGLSSATLATVPGASQVLRGGLITYATDLKHSLAGVDEKQLENDGPVAASTARAMATGAQDSCGATWGVSLTGVAGPDSQDGHPVGEVFIGIAAPDGVTAHRAEASGNLGKFALSDATATPVRVLAGDRATIRRAAVRCAFEALLAAVEGEPGPAAVR